MNIITAFFPAFLLLSGAAAAGSTGFTPLIEAVVQTPDEYAIDALIKKGGRLNDTDETGRTVLMLAAMYNSNPAVIYMLVKHGADVNARTPDTGMTPLFFAVRYNPNPEIIMTLLSNHADKDIRDIFGKKAVDYIDRNPKLKNSVAELALNMESKKQSQDSSESAMSR